MSDPAKRWMRSIAYHTYWNVAQEPGTFYMVDTEQDAETLIALKKAVREDPPPSATREPDDVTPSVRRVGRAVKPLTQADMPTSPTRRE